MNGSFRESPQESGERKSAGDRGSKNQISAPGKKPAREMDQPNDVVPSSPSVSSVSSSDLDTESTGSFFHDRSTSLGTLMGVRFPAVSASAQGEINAVDGGGIPARRERPRADKRRIHGRRWWRLCREESRATSLADFLEIERRFGDAAEHRFLYGAAPAEGNRLFADGRVLPPTATAAAAAQSPAAAAAAAACSISGICCGGGG
ncbi:hypothetical protein H6P81_016338 [Aristolochia fimbriata]|uniref:Uncharacterized protein n=1 Tax=Aristolochia fimbriata TaxID=158543 RepID=A0AAV7E852_ARIFI|nr:hypothetical protein H6P81_016338 [Aristolochia fimbriata]